jgi:penicillin-binding protein 2
MLNQGVNPYLSAGESADRLDIDGATRPRARLACLFVLMFLALATIAARYVQVQSTLLSSTIAEFERTTERRESIPTHDGRILSGDGQVLAHDRDVYGVAVHYRWLEEPPDPLWLKGQSLARLDRAERRDPAKVAAQTERVLTERESLLRELTRISGKSRRELDANRARIQQRVERIYSTVAERRAASSDALPQEPAQASPDDSLWSRAWHAIVLALTTSPEREATEPLIIEEQLAYHLLLREVPLETALEIEARPERYPGTRLEVTSRREYPQGPLAAHLVGYRTPLDAAELAPRRDDASGSDPFDYRVGDRAGRAGLERFYERHLRGLRGERKLVLNRRGEVVRTEIVREPRFGRDLVLSVNLPMQQAAEKLLDDALSIARVDETTGKPLPIPQGGSIVALDVRTGAILAAASAPRFDPGMLIDGDAQSWRALLSDARKPLFHRAAEMQLPPGSIFKVASAVAFLESGRVDPEQAFHCQGFLDEPDRYRCFVFKHFGVGHGDVDLVAALARSCNVYFFDAARRTGAGPICKWAERFGFGRPTGIDLPSERSGNLPLPRTRSATRSGQNSMQLAIGQSSVTATPLQVARMMAAGW